jgi:hypothetical protein
VDAFSHSGAIMRPTAKAASDVAVFREHFHALTGQTVVHNPQAEHLSASKTTRRVVVSMVRALVGHRAVHMPQWIQLCSSRDIFWVMG